jgi:hypothetical protein
MARYRIWNGTDNIPCDFNRTYTSKKKVLDRIEELRNGFRDQGYYRDNNWNKIAPEDIDYQIITIGKKTT